jgi:hypothetical protein
MGNLKRFKVLVSATGIFLLLAASISFVGAKSVNSKAGNPPGKSQNGHSGNFTGSSLLLIPHGNKVKVTEIDESDEEQKSEEVEEFTLETEDGDTNEATEGGETVSIKANNNAAMVIKNKLAAQTHFPLKVNLETNELMVTTPKGSKIVTVLPDKAVANMLAANVLDQLGGKGGYLWQLSQPTPTATSSATPSATASGTPNLSPTETPSGSSTPSATPTSEVTTEESSPIQLVLTDDGTLAYQINGVKIERLLGLLNVRLNRLVIVSAENGQLLEVQQNLPTKILDFFSF